MNNVELVKQVYENFAAGNIPGVLEAFDPEIEWHEPSFEFVVDRDPFIGPQAVLENVFMNFQKYFDGISLEVKQVFGSGDNVAMAGYFVGKWKKTGKQFKANVCHVWAVKDGRLTRFFGAADTAEIMNP